MHSPHFDEKDALRHVVEKHAEGVLAFGESHGTEIPSAISAAADATRETTLVLTLFGIVLSFSLNLSLSFFLSLALGWVVWKTGRSAWLGWSRLERLHRIIEQEKFEIEHHRHQEREELSALYRAKGFEGRLLEEVIDVLMADQDRLLKVMLEEELGLALGVIEHPLKQALGAFLGAAITSLILLVAAYFFFIPGLIIGAVVMMMAGAVLSAVYEKNRIISAITWNCAVGILASGITYYIFKLLPP